MKESTLKQIKQDIRKFLPIAEKVSQFWKIPIYATMSVIIQNMAIDVTGTVGYSHEREVKNLYDGLDILKEISLYYDSHFESWVFEEIDLTIFGYVMAEDLD